jgi:hypothetical protein
MDRCGPPGETVRRIGRQAVLGILVAGRAFLGLLRHARPVLLA